MSELMTLREICIKGGVTRRIVQGYERRKLVAPIATNKYGHLLYDERGLKAIKEIRLYQKFGFNLDDISRLNSISEEEKKKMLIKQLAVMEEKRNEYEELIKKAKEIIKNMEG